MPPREKSNLAISSLSLDIAEGDEYPINIEGSWTGDLEANPVYIQALDQTNTTISSVAIDATNTPSFAVSTHTNGTLTAGAYSSKIQVRACKDMACSSVYAGDFPKIDVSLHLFPVPEWETHQANRFHNGYVPIWINSTDFAQKWEWPIAASADPISAINAPVAGNGTVYITTDGYHKEGALIALNELDGTEAWRDSFGIMPAVNPPAIGGEKVYAATSGHKRTKLWAFSRNDGRIQFQADFSGQWPHFLAPTVDRDKAFQAGGYYGNRVYAFSTANGASICEAAPGDVWDMYTPAVDDQSVYVHSGRALSIIDKANGKTVSTIDDPFGSSTSTSYFGAPAKGGRNNIVSFSGGGFSGLANSNTEQYGERVISSFSIDSATYEWSTQFTYLTHFAIANGVIYAGKTDPVSLDAIDEATGNILWSWVPPKTDDSSFHRNVVATKNLVFVSTNFRIYAIDLVTRQAIWSYEEPGMLAITDNRTLLLATGMRKSDGRLLAFDLR